MSSKLEIQWTPITNKFITWGSEICLYEVHQDRDNVLQSIKLSSTTSANLLATNTNHHYVKCLDVYPKSDADLLLAVGLSNGRISLSTFGPTEYDALGLTGKELVPRHARQCNAVCWNTIETSLVAAGLDKYRSDNSVLIWDIMKSSQNNENNSGRMAVNTMAPGVELAKPIAEFGVSETAHSMAWFSSNSKVIAVGMNMKNIKFVDIRDPNKITNSTLTKAVFGVCMDPNDDRHLASFSENNIYVWDTRNFEKPILTLHQNKPVIKIAWCPTKYNLLGSLQKESSVINLYDIQHTVIGNEEVEPSVLERNVVPGSPHNIMSFSWHNSDENRFLTIALSGTITDYTVFDRITLNWAPTSNVVWTYGRKTMKYINDTPLQDISTKIRERALSGYGLKAEIYKNGEVVDNEMLANVWNWLFLSGKLVEDGVLAGTQCKHPGVQAVLKLDPSNNKSDHYSLLWSDLGNKNCQGVVRIFKHEDRDKALHLCSWHFERDSNQLTAFLEQLEKEGAYTRAAAIAVFSLKIRLAIEILSRAPETLVFGLGLNVVAMALAGFTDDKNSVWKQFCSTAKQKLSDPYLKVIFSFLTAENYNFESVLNESGVTVDDRVAFACMFLPDNRLHDYLKKLSDKLIEEGNLDGLLLTGTNHDGIKLLQRYLDATGDIQSTAVIAVRAFPVEQFSEVIKDWVSSYRNLLDTWQLWNERAHFDIMLSTYCPADKPPQQVYVSCNFCGKSISAYMYGLTRGRGPFTRIGGTANKLKMSSCPNCRKPLPRCAICLMHMGTTTGNFSSEVDSSKIIEFSNWFTWCQTCRHGGHVSHMTHWFDEHSECPVTACTCKCFSVDSLSNAIIK
ncbi:GATOR complex protein MIOS-B [Tribolium madens]|uniref:GATOR complex protein MIOS-B n=1 Tax=Tribolium madens TaxID=41895 RepID=UPI001CF72D6F|nr:GATOR complex protein MIOS-B [Tribolium madens]